MAMSPSGSLVVPVGGAGVGAIGVSGPDLPAVAANYVGGRRNNAWQYVLPLAGSGEYSRLSGGISFGSQVAGSPTDLSRHLDLYGGQYGFSVTGGTLNIVSGGHRHLFWGQGGWEIRYRELWFTSDGWRLNWNPANGNLLYLDWASNARWGWYEGRFVVWGDISWNYGHAGDNRGILTGGRGVAYLNVGGNGFNFDFDGWSLYGRVDNAVSYPFWNVACDEVLKQDVAEASFDCLATVRKLRLYQYRRQDWRNPSRPRPAQAEVPTIPIGFIAQRLAEDFPEAVVRPQAERRVGALGMWNVDVNTMLATLYGAVQQLADEVEGY